MLVTAPKGVEREVSAVEKEGLDVLEKPRTLLLLVIILVSNIVCQVCMDYIIFLIMFHANKVPRPK